MINTFKFFLEVKTGNNTGGLTGIEMINEKLVPANSLSHSFTYDRGCVVSLDLLAVML